MRQIWSLLPAILNFYNYYLHQISRPTWMETFSRWTIPPIKIIVPKRRCILNWDLSALRKQLWLTIKDKESLLKYMQIRWGVLVIDIWVVLYLCIGGFHWTIFMLNCVGINLKCIDSKLRKCANKHKFDTQNERLPRWLCLFRVYPQLNIWRQVKANRYSGFSTWKSFESRYLPIEYLPIY